MVLGLTILAITTHIPTQRDFDANGGLPQRCLSTWSLLRDHEEEEEASAYSFSQLTTKSDHGFPTNGNMITFVYFLVTILTHARHKPNLWSVKDQNDPRTQRDLFREWLRKFNFSL